MSAKGTLSCYLQTATIHGVYYLRRGSVVRRLCWFVAIATSFVMAFEIIVRGFVDNDSNPFISTLRTVPVSQVPFPAISFLPHQFTDYSLEEQVWESALLNVNLDCSHFKTKDECSRDPTTEVTFGTWMEETVNKAFWSTYNSVQEKDLDAFKLCGNVGNIDKELTRLNSFIEDGHLFIKSIGDVLEKQIIDGGCVNLDIVAQQTARRSKMEFEQGLLDYLSKHNVTKAVELPPCRNNEGGLSDDVKRCLLAFIYSQGSYDPLITPPNSHIDRFISQSLKETQTDSARNCNDTEACLFNYKMKSWNAHPELTDCLVQNKILGLLKSLKMNPTLELISRPHHVLGQSSRVTGKTAKKSHMRFRWNFSLNSLIYSVNAGSFWDIFKKTEYTRAFQNGDSDNQGQKIWNSAFSGPDFSYLALIDPGPSYSILTLHSPEVLPHMWADPVYLQRGQTYALTVNAYQYKVDDNVAKLEPKDRDCLLPDDPHRLKLFNQYSQQNCVAECKWEIAAQNCQCAPIYIPRADKDEWTICQTKLQAECFMAEVANVNPAEQCKCQQDCNVIAYSVEKRVTESQRHKLLSVCQRLAHEGRTIWDLLMPKEHYGPANDVLYLAGGQEDQVRMVLDGESAKYCQVLQENYALVEVFMASPRAYLIETSLRMTLIDKVANFGGTLGLFTGMSILSMFEVLYWVLKGMTGRISWRGFRNGLCNATIKQNKYKRSKRLSIEV